MFRRGRLIAWLALAACGVIVSLRSVTAGTSPTTAIFVDNSNYVTAYPIGSKGDVAPIAVTTDMISPGGIARDSIGRIYVTNTPTNAVTIYAAGASGNVPPVAVIGGPLTQLVHPTGIALDASGKIYVLNTGTSNITVYAPLASTGIVNEAPVANISGTNTALNRPASIAVDSAGDIYVANDGGGPPSSVSGYVSGTITIYSAGGNGNVAPRDTIVGSATELGSPSAIALDSDGDIYVGDAVVGVNNTVIFPAGINVYPSGTSGNAAPIAIIIGKNTGLGVPQGLAVDSAHDIYEAKGNAISFFPASSNGNVAPTATIAGFLTGLNSDAGITLDSSGNLYVSNNLGGPFSLGSVTVYAAGSSGNAAPIETITSNVTGIEAGTGIAIDSTGKVYLPNLSTNAIDIYPSGSYATSSPIASISGSNTGLFYPLGLALDAKGDLAALNDNNTITVYPASTAGNVTPSRTIDVDRHKGNSPSSVALDADGRLYLASQPNCKGGCQGSSLGSIGIFGAESHGYANPKDIITGPDTQLAFPIGIAVSNRRRIFVLNQPPVCAANCGCFPGPNGSISVYASDSAGDAKPIAVLEGSLTGMTFPRAIAIDSNENIYVLADPNVFATEEIGCWVNNSTEGWTPRIRRKITTAPRTNSRADSEEVWILPPTFDFGSGAPDILFFPAGSRGNIRPAIIGGPLTGLDGYGIAIGPAGP
jgi:sugar lactone lactonase YvrE